MQVWPTEFGTQKKWNFLFEKSYWYKEGKTFGSPYKIVASNQSSSPAAEENSQYAHIEEVPASLQAQIQNKVCVDVQGLFKQFNTTNGVKVAVDRLNLTMFQGQITALLGHNGAGKTTTLSMLTGLLPADGGTAVIDGYDLNSEMVAIRRKLGVCPQHDILFPELTVEEHLQLFAFFKGTKKEFVLEEVEKAIVSVGLTEKRKEFSKNLSGGQKRKLSVAIAFIGNSKIGIICIL